MEVAIACGIGAVVALTELLNRYHHLSFGPGIVASLALYILVNVAAAALAILFVGADSSAQTAGIAGSTVGNGLIAGFGASALLRSSFFNYRVGDKDINVGPAALLDVLRSAADRAL